MQVDIQPENNENTEEESEPFIVENPTLVSCFLSLENNIMFLFKTQRINYDFILRILNPMQLITRDSPNCTGLCSSQSTVLP